MQGRSALNEVLRVKPILRLLITLCACLAACIEAPDGPESSLETQDFAAGSDGSHSQGTELHGTRITAVSYSSASVVHADTRRSAKLRLVKGELAADMPLSVSGTTASLNSCWLRATGPERGCGFVVEGQGVCTPRSTVTLTSGACLRERGSCTGTPVVRVCSGEAPCEHQERDRHLATGEYTCGSSCPTVQFACPSSGIYTVMAGPYSTGQTWSVDLVANTGTFPATSKEFRGRALVGARIIGLPAGGTAHVLEVVDATNASNVAIPESPGIWDSSGATWLYHVRHTGTSSTPGAELCATDTGTSTDAGTDTGWAWAVPVRGLYDAAGGRQESTASFTLGCDTGVISKCYRWGYKPWLDGAVAGDVTKAHWACTRMARADYCGKGISFTKDGTKIRPWDELTPAAIIPAPDAGTPGMSFEAAWGTHGPTCLSHWRWKDLDAGHCVQLNPPIPGDDGGIANDCRDPYNPYGPGKCSQVCDTPGEAKWYFGGTVFNNSGANVPDAGTTGP